MDIWQKMYEQAQALYHPQEVSDFVYAKHVVKMDKSSQAFVWKELVVFSTYVPKGRPFSICIKRLVRPRLSVLLPFETSRLTVVRLVCLVEPVGNF